MNTLETWLVSEIVYICKVDERQESVSLFFARFLVDVRVFIAVLKRFNVKNIRLLSSENRVTS